MNILSGFLFVGNSQFVILDLPGITRSVFVCYRDDVPHKECHQGLRSISRPLQILTLSWTLPFTSLTWPRHGPDLELSESIPRQALFSYDDVLRTKPAYHVEPTRPVAAALGRKTPTAARLRPVGP